MKGFYIDVTNNLLDPKHCNQMGEAVWLFMYLLDRITSITEEGMGVVNGGHPITSKMVTEELGKSDKTYRRWAKVLQVEGYIEVERAEQGLVFIVKKAKKRFGRSVEKDRTIENSDRSEMAKRSVVDGRSDLTITITGQERKEKNSKEKKESELRVSQQAVLDLWNSLGIVIHKNWPESANVRFAYLLGSIGLPAILETIKVYSAVLKDPNCFFSYKWNLAAFIQRKNGCEEWFGKSVDDYKSERPKTKQAGSVTIRDGKLITSEVPF